MDTKKTCYLFLDYDGTVTDKKRIPRQHREALLRAKRLGHKLILCTGRSWGFLQTSPQYRSIPWDGIIVGGAEIHWKGRCIYRRRIEDADVLRLARFALRQGACLSIEGEQSYLMVRRGKNLLPMDDQRSYARVQRFLRMDHVTKMSILPCTELIPEVRAEFLLHGGGFGEFGPAGCSKGRAIEIFCRKVGIPLSQCAAFGDSLNDLAMFELLPERIAMQHAPKKLIRAATYTAKGAYGVAEGIEYLFGPAGT